MKTTVKILEKQTYISPEIKLIKLDNDISLQLESTPPFGPEETNANIPEYFNQEPFKSIIS